MKDVRASQDTLIDLFSQMESFFKRLEKYIKVRPTAALTDIIVKIMVEVLSILGIVTKETGQGKMSMSFHVNISAQVDVRAERFLKKLAGMKDIEDALLRLEKLTQEEALMAAAEGLTITRDIGDKVEGVDEGEFFRQRFTRSGVKEIGVAIQEVVNQVTHINRSCSSNIIADHESLTSLSGNELRKDLRKWIAPPNPSVNFHSASGAHHEGTTAWCTKGSTVANWKKSGSLLWIHGKRTYPFPF